MLEPQRRQSEQRFSVLARHSRHAIYSIAQSILIWHRQTPESMAPHLATSQHHLIRDMILDGTLTAAQMATAAGCSKRSVKAIRSNLRHFHATKAPANGGGRRRSIAPPMLDALRERLLEKPGLYLEEMALFLWDEFGVLVSTHSISRTLRAVGWSKKVARQIAREQNAELRDFYLHNLTQFQSYHLVFIDESGCDKRIGFRRTGWSPLGVAPVQVAKFHRDRRYQILPAYTQDGILLSRVYQGSTDSAVFEDYIEQLLPHCGRWPEPKSVLVMDNAPFHHTERLEQMCCDAGVKLMYLPPYSPDLNPIEEFFSELKAFIKKNWRAFEDAPEQGFDAFFRMVYRHGGWKARQRQRPL
jgi:transposase